MVPMLTKKVTSRSPDRGLKKFLALWPACFSGLSHVWNIVHYFIASSILVLVLLSNLLWGIADVNAAIPVSWTVDKPLAEVLPNEDLVTLSFKVETPPGKPGVTGAVPVRIKLIAPQTHPLVTTDFPHVENSVLLDFIAYAREGAFTLKQVFPIRGDYRLWVAPVEPPAGRDSAPSLSGDTDRLAEKKELSPESSPSPEIVLQVLENPTKIRTLSLFLLGLSLICALSGFILARGHISRMALSTAGVLTLLIGLAGQGWEIFLPVLSVSLSENAHAHSKPHSKHEEDAEKNSGAAPHGGVTSPQDPTLPWELKTERFPENPKVGEPMTIRAKLLSRKTEKTIPTLFKLVIKQLEHDQEVFSAELYEPDGVLEWRGSLFDGSAHKVHIVGIPLDKDIASLTPPQLEPGPAHIAPGTAHPPWATAEMEIDVEALEPTLGSIVKSFSLLMVISGISLSLGLWGGFATSPKLSKVQLGSVIQGRAPKST